MPCFFWYLRLHFSRSVAIFRDSSGIFVNSSSQMGMVSSWWFPITPTYSSRPSMNRSTRASVPTRSWMNLIRSCSFSSSSTTEAWEMPMEASRVSDFTKSGKPSFLLAFNRRPLATMAKCGTGMRWYESSFLDRDLSRPIINPRELHPV